MQALVPVIATPYLTPQSKPTSGTPFWGEEAETHGAQSRCTRELCLHPHLCLSVCLSNFPETRLESETSGGIQAFRDLPWAPQRMPHLQPRGSF